MRYYVVIDTNVLVSALLTKNKGSATAKVIYIVAAARLALNRIEEGSAEGLNNVTA